MTKKITKRKRELKEQIAEIKRKIDWCPNVSFDRPKFVQDINLLKGELKGIKFVENEHNRTEK